VDDELEKGIRKREKRPRKGREKAKEKRKKEYRFLLFQII